MFFTRNSEGKRRRALGYGDTNEIPSGSGTNNEEERRHALGYDGSADETGKRS